MEGVAVAAMLAPVALAGRAGVVVAVAPEGVVRPTESLCQDRLAEGPTSVERPASSTGRGMPREDD